MPETQTQWIDKLICRVFPPAMASALSEISNTDFLVTTFQEIYINGNDKERERVILNALQRYCCSSQGLEMSTRQQNFINNDKINIPKYFRHVYSLVHYKAHSMQVQKHCSMF